ncbi:MAG: 2-oxoacid:acceptor oxidoreductase subunit alpha [Acidobacteriota bacterium]|nr:2-oxoacid:acceptor oxidoreductase subunit alpha [Blastocatellia bacterium]MDW8238827.1 2-oxoacid:acceptor oxidoreductase subunit alpha [Acidobacteriota bacterium]
MEAATVLPLEHRIEELDSVTIRFSGDSGDGMQLTGTQFTNTTAVVGNDLATLPDFPAEIRAPAGSLPGVSSFQVNFSRHDIRTPGDQPDVLVAMNPAALKVNLPDLVEGGILLVNTDSFTEVNLLKAGYKTNPLEDGSLAKYRVYKVPITTLTLAALKDVEIPHKQAERCKNFFALGLMYWLYDRPLDTTYKWIQTKFAKNPAIAQANTLAVKAGYAYGEATEMFTTHYRVRRAAIEPGVYRNVTGNEATAIGFIAASQLANRPLFYASYPITPASDILHELSMHKNFGVKTFQAEDEIAAVCAAIGAAFAGYLGLTGTSGPGLALKSEAINLAVMTELPLVIVDVQRAGPSTGMPTKTEQADLLQAMFGRNSDSPVVVVAPASPADCFTMAIEAFRLATKYMVPVIYLSDGYLANGAEPWKIPSIESLPKFDVKFRTDPEGFYPYLRDETTLARPWAIPGTPGLEHRIGGIEKHHLTGNVSYDPENHQLMTNLRAEKVARIAQDIPEVEVTGAPEGDLLVVGWGGTYGAITSAVERVRAQGAAVSSVHLRYLNPFPRNLGDILQRFKKVLVAELNNGQLALLIRARYLVDALSYAKVKGQPFKIAELVQRIEQVLATL